MLGQEKAYSEYDYILRTFENILKKEVNSPVKKRRFKINVLNTAPNFSVCNNRTAASSMQNSINNAVSDNIVSNYIPEDVRLFMTLDELEAESKTCTRCPYCKDKIGHFFGNGCKNKPDVVAIMGGPNLVPTEEDDKTLNTWLSHISLYRELNLYVCSPVKCISKSANIDNVSKECLLYLKQQILLLKPKMVICVGISAFNYLSRKDLNVNISADDKESPYGRIQMINKIPVLTIYHPQDIKLNEKLKLPVWESLKRIANSLKLEIIGKNK